MKPKIIHINYFVIPLILALLVLTSRSVFAYEQDSHINRATEWLIITDSYGVTPLDKQNQSWPFQFQKMMGLSNSEVCFLRLDGHGYARTGRQYIKHVKKLPNSRNMKRIIVTGGINNDKAESLKKIKSEMKTLNNLFKKKFPNARVYMAAPNWDSRERKHTFLRERKAIYRSYGEALGWKWFKRTSSALVGETGWWLSDYHHPNAKGGKLIAEEVFYAFRGYNLQYLLNFTANGGKGKMNFIVYNYGEDYTVPACKFKRSGYTFTGWKNMKNGKIYKAGQSFRNLTYTNEDVIEFKAQWKKNI